MDPTATLRRIRELRVLASVTRYKEDHFDYLCETWANTVLRELAAELASGANDA